ncbi:ATP-binding protein [Paraburkholderia fungorum]|uniref:ATP-binding protein n=1 Tax=Paraburkholderia fungorum TaxID=134537 RepID=UPI0038BBDECF
MSSDFLSSEFLAGPNQYGSGEAVSFGPFRLFPDERRLERAGAALRLGSRALDILIVLIQHAGEVVDRRILMSRAWRNIVVDESNLRVNIAGLRKALGDGKGGVHYVQNVPGIGYCFVGQLTRERMIADCTALSVNVPDTVPARQFVSHATGLSGRDDAVQSLASALTRQRLISIVGPGGIGKTTVAIALANRLAASFPAAVYVVDLSEVISGDKVALTLAHRLGLSDSHDEPLACLLRHLSNRRVLIVLDNCEHLIDDVATLTEQLISGCAEAHFVLTSREALRIKGEHVYRLPALNTPPPSKAISAEEACTYPAVQLFIERALAAGATFEQTEQNCAAIADICRELDGIALAIEFAAARVATFGLAGTLSLLGTRSRLQWQGCRNAPARHRKLEASIEWSYQLLSERERLVFRRLSSFEQPATLEAILAAAANRTAELPDAIEAIEGLVARHLLLVLPGQDGVPRYRLMASERIYAQEQLRQAEIDQWSGESDRSAWIE